MQNLHTYVPFLHELAETAAARTLPLFRSALTIENKAEDGIDDGIGDGLDPVTVADRETEAAMRRLINKRYPDHGILGEEYGAENLDADWVWVLDPIDGTRGFICGIPLWGTLIGLKKSGAPFLGLMNQPFTGERFWSTERETHYRGPDGERKLQTRSCPDLKDAILSTTDPGYFEAGFETEKYQSLAAGTRLNRFGGDCYAYCMLAAGNIDLVIETGLKPFDIMALIPIITRAGGMITSWTGGDASNGGRVLATGDPALHDKILKIISK